MLKKIILPLKKNIKVIALIFFVIITILISLYLNNEKNLSVKTYNNFIRLLRIFISTYDVAKSILHLF